MSCRVVSSHQIKKVGKEVPHDKSKNGVVIEIKQIKKQQKSEKNPIFIKRINKQIKAASKQIDSNKYYKELIENKIAVENIIKISDSFCRERTLYQAD